MTFVSSLLTKLAVHRLVKYASREVVRSVLLTITQVVEEEVERAKEREAQLRATRDKLPGSK